MTKVINLFGGPGVGKSTIANGLVYHLRLSGKSVELVSEYAKDVTYEGTHALLENQLHIFSEQYRRQSRLLGKVDYIVTDSPLLLSCVYLDFYQSKKQSFKNDYITLTKYFFSGTFAQFNNLNFYIERTVAYDNRGRNETYVEAKKIDKNIRDLLESSYIDYDKVTSMDGMEYILRYLESLE